MKSIVGYDKDQNEVGRAECGDRQWLVSIGKQRILAEKPETAKRLLRDAGALSFQSN